MIPSPGNDAPTTKRGNAMNKIITVAVLMLATFAVHAQNSRVAKADADVNGLPYRHVFDAVSTEGETLHQFLRRVGVDMRAFSDRTGFEACAAIGTDGARFGVVVGTSTARIGCAVYPGKVSAGMRYVGDSIHTHGTDENVRLNKADMILAGITDARGVIRVSGQQLDRFSDADFHNSGYLAAPGGRLLYQSGKGTEREIVE